MKYIVTGSSGFISSNYCWKLINDGHQVRTIPRELLYSYFDLKSYLEAEKPDVILHFAAWGNHSTQTDLDQIIAVNIGCTTTLLQASKNVNYKAFINIGSSSEYGNKKEPMNELDLPQTDTFYGASKVATTYISRAFAKQHNKPIVTVRPFSVYGPGEATHRFLPNAIKASKIGAGFNLSPNPKHDWIYIDDFISGVEKVIENVDRLGGEVINIGTGKQYTNKHLIDIIEKIHGSSLDYVVIDRMRNYDSENWVADNSLLKSLGWKQKVSLEDGLKRTYEYY